MKRFVGLFVLALISAGANATQSNSLQDIVLEIPDGWNQVQSAKANETLLLSYSKGDDLVSFYVRRDPVENLRDVFATGAMVQKEEAGSHGPISWRKIWTSKSTRKEAIYVNGFASTVRGFTYFGYSRSKSAQQAEANANRFLDGITIHVIGARSLTGEGYTGKKYYLGWGAAGFGDPQMMHNEVKYDVLHTHDIFTKEIGGNYIGTQLVGTGKATASAIRNEWKRIGGLLSNEDMYVQYSSGHGSSSGLGVGVSYNEIRDNALSYPAKEIIVFIMACHSGGLVDRFDQKKSVWGDWQNAGRTLFVMASSKASQLSSTGPGKDEEEPNGPEGSAGSAFGHALWKALIGHADGQIDGVKDGFLSLGEIRDYSVMKTEQVGGHTPVHTGAYNASLIMNQVPSKEFLAQFENGTDGLSDAEVIRKIQELDASMRITRQ